MHPAKRLQRPALRKRWGLFFNVRGVMTSIGIDLSLKDASCRTESHCWNIHGMCKYFSHSFIHSFLPSFIPSFLPSFLPSFFLPSFLHSFFHSFIPSFLPSFIHSFNHSFIHSVRQAVRQSGSQAVRQSVSQSFMHSVIESFSQSFIHICLYRSNIYKCYMWPSTLKDHMSLQVESGEQLQLLLSGYLRII